MAIFRGSQSKTGGILKNCLALIQLFHLRTLYQITGYADYVAVAGVEGQVAQIHFESAFDNIQYVFRIAVYRQVDGEDIAGAGSKIFMKVLQYL